MRRGFHGSYLGAHSILRAHPIGVVEQKPKNPKNRVRRGSAIVWAGAAVLGTISELSSDMPTRILNRAEVDKLKHIKSKVKVRGGTSVVVSSGIAGSRSIFFSEDTLRESEALIGLGGNGFGKFMVETNSKLRDLKSKDLIEIAEIFNKQGWKTFTGVSWTANLVGVFCQLCRKSASDTRLVRQKSKSKKKKSYLR
jgi:hypothetical protein